MKIIAIGRNYAEHAKELNNPIPTTPVIFLKPDDDVHFELEVVLKICKEGKHIAEKFAANYYDEIGLGIDFTARDIQSKHKEKGLPWELAKAFDNSAPISTFLPKSDFENLYDLNFELQINEEIRQKGHTKDLLFSFEKIISFVSQYITLKKGDLIFTGTPEGVGKINKGDKIAAWLEGKQLLNFEAK